jgi:hypothetical protein
MEGPFCNGFNYIAKKSKKSSPALGSISVIQVPYVKLVSNWIAATLAFPCKFWKCPSLINAIRRHDFKHTIWLTKEYSERNYVFL